MKNDEIMLLLIVVGIVMGFGFGIVIGSNTENNKFKNEAVKEGHAEYIADEDGNPQWQWKDINTNEK